MLKLPKIYTQKVTILSSPWEKECGNRESENRVEYVALRMENSWQYVDNFHGQFDR